MPAMDRMVRLFRGLRYRLKKAVLPLPAAPALDVNVILHDSRGAMLRQMPGGAQRLLSAGCAGAWYFDWIEQTYGPVAEHLGIEYYSEQPPVLPGYVTWIRNTASDMSAVADQSCDLLFSGQNLEHLWPEEVAGFLLEAARVLRPGGHLVADSPNRTVTAPLCWSHPEHTIELTPAEVTDLLRLAGFDLTVMKGIYACRDGRTGRMLPFDPNQVDADWPLTQRLVAAVQQPEDSFIWWAEAIRSDRTPDAAALTAMTSALFAAHWPERVQRLLVSDGVRLTETAGGTWVEAPAGFGGAVFFGPYMPLRAGRYRCTWRLRPPAAARGDYAACDIMAGNDVLASTMVAAGADQASLEFSLSGTTFGLQFRCLGLGGPAFAALRRIDLEALAPAP